MRFTNKGGGFMGEGYCQKVFWWFSLGKNRAKVKPELMGLKMALPPYWLPNFPVATGKLSSYQLPIADSLDQWGERGGAVWGAGYRGRSPLYLLRVK